MSKNGFFVEPIGFAHSVFDQKFGCPRQSGLVEAAQARIEFLPAVQPELSLQGLEGFSHVWILFWFHANGPSRRRAKIRPPRLHGAAAGVFATRSPHRPNPVGLSLARLLAVGPDFIDVAGIDFIERTPVLDIKPYLPEFEAIPVATSGWVEALGGAKLNVEFSPEAEAVLRCHPLTSSGASLRQTVVELLRLDPRPSYQRRLEVTKPEYGMNFEAWNVKFRFLADDRCEVTRLLWTDGQAPAPALP